MSQAVRFAAVGGCLAAAVAFWGRGPTAAIIADEPAAAAAPAKAADLFDLPAWLDARFGQVWSENQVQPEVCDDATFCRRVSLDLIGRIPSVAEVRAFLDDPSPTKRAQLVDRLIADPDVSSRTSELHAEHMARIWRRVILPPGSTGAPMAPMFEPWLKAQFRENKPYDEIVRRLLTARGENTLPEAVFYQAIGGSPDAEATTVSRVFLGVRIGCAQCHDHPFTTWKQQDFWGMAAFFEGTSASTNAMTTPEGATVAAGLSDDAATGSIAHEGKTYAAKALWSTEPVSLGENQKPRDALAAWLTSSENPTFAANVVNRIWQHLLGRGLVSAVDDLDLATPEERELVIDDLGRQFAAAGFDLKWLIAGICKSKAYQCTAHVADGEQITLLYGRRPLKTMTPEQTFDSLEQALALPVSRSSEEAARHNGEMAQVVQRLDESIGTSPEDYSAGVPQVLLLMNGELLAKATDLNKSHTLRAVVESPFLGDEIKLDTLYLAALTRLPRANERQQLLQHLQSQPDEPARRQTYGDIFWALLNSPEFVLCR
jgi:hypothetical protein